MKTNKFAAGALALAFGLSAVAPTFATATTPAAAVTTVNAPEMFAQRYAEELKKANALKSDADTAKARLDKAEVAEADARKRVKEAAVKYADLGVVSEDKVLLAELQQARRGFAAVADQVTRDNWGKVTRRVDLTAASLEAMEQHLETQWVWPTVKWVGNEISGYTLETTGRIGAEKVVIKAAPAKTNFAPILNKAGSAAVYGYALNPAYDGSAPTTTSINGYMYVSNAANYAQTFDVVEFVETKLVNGVSTVVKSYYTNNPKWAATKVVTDAVEASTQDYTLKEFDAAYDRYVNAYNLYWNYYKNRADEKTKLYHELLAAERAYDAAVSELELAKKDAEPKLRLYNEALGKLYSAAKGYNVTLDATGKEILVKGLNTAVTPAPSKGVTEAQLKDLQKAADEARAKIEAVKFLKTTTPKTISKVVDKLDKLVAEQEARLVKAQAILDANKKTASLFFSTAYASETTGEDVDSLIKDLNDTTKAIEDTLTENEAAQPAEEPKAEETTKEENKKDDKEDEKVNEKVVEKTVVKEVPVNKAAGSNAKTGIAGVAGVAGVLAAASVAYAASKKNN